MTTWVEPVVGRHRHDGRDEPVLLWRPPEPVLAISSAPLGGGLGVRHWVLNAQVPKRYDRADPDVHLSEVAGALGCSGEGVGLCTAASVARVRRAADGGVVADATVGLSHPTWAAAPGPSPFCESPRTAADRKHSQNRGPGMGTVNLVVWVPVRLADAALVNAVATATEAKTQALVEAGVTGTGTASDAVCVCCPTGGPAEPYAGPRSPWGARLARAVHGAVAAGTAAWLQRNGAS